MRSIELALLLAIASSAALCAQENNQQAQKQPADAPDKGDRIQRLANQSEQVVKALDQSDWDNVINRFDTNMRTALPKETLVKTWTGIAKQLGALKEITGKRRTTKDTYEAIYVACTFQRGQMELKLVFDTEDKIAGLFLLPAGKYKPPAYAQADKVTTREVKVGGGLLNLSGTLMVPKTASAQQKVPAVVLVHGSGPQDRDETIGPNKPFLDLAYGLSAQGIAVLRYEKRTRQYQSVMAVQSRTLTVREETIDDVVAAVEVLRGQPEIDAKQIFVLGHSLGGMLLPRIAERTPDVAGFVGLAASARPLEDLILQQTEEILHSQPKLTDEETAELAKLRQQIALVKSDQLNVKTPADSLPLGIPAAYWLDLRDYQPAESAKSIGRPLLLVHGGRDYQVTEDDWRIWQAALSAEKHCTLRHYPTLNHLFMAGEGRSKPAEYTQPGHVDAQLIVDLADWIKSH